MKKYRPAVFIIPYSKTEKGTEFLLLKRKLHWRGWEFSKGGIKNKESKEKAAKRELLEETGLKLKKLKKLKYSGKYLYEKDFTDRPGYKGQTFSLFAAEIKKDRIRLDKKEHSGFRWVDFKKAMKILTWPNQKKSLKIVNDWLKDDEI